MIVKSTQRSWKTAVSSPKGTFTCVCCEQEVLLKDGFSNEVVFQRADVYKAAQHLWKLHEEVNGVTALLACW